jgi:hypothetical protein
MQLFDVFQLFLLFQFWQIIHLNFLISSAVNLTIPFAILIVMAFLVENEFVVRRVYASVGDGLALGAVSRLVDGRTFVKEAGKRKRLVCHAVRLAILLFLQNALREPSEMHIQTIVLMFFGLDAEIRTA